MTLRTYALAFLGTARLLLVAVAFAALSYVSLDIGYMDATLFFAVCGGAVLFLYFQRYAAELNKRRAL